MLRLFLLPILPKRSHTRSTMILISRNPPRILVTVPQRIWNGMRCATIISRALLGVFASLVAGGC